MTTISIHPRRVARECILKALFAYYYTNDDYNKILDSLITKKPRLKKNADFIHFLFEYVQKHMDWAEDQIKSHLENWDLDRVALIDKILLKMGICEIYFMDDIPPKVTISEMVEISKIYSTDESPVFINGILDAVYKDYKNKEKE